MKTLIIYHTKTGHTLEAINPFAEALKEEGVEVQIVLAKNFKPDMLKGCDSLFIGAPCWTGVAGGDGIPGPINRAIDRIPNNALEGILCGGLAIYSIGGGDVTIAQLKNRVTEKGCANFKSGPVIRAGVPLSLFKGKSVSKVDEELVRKFAKEFIS